MLKKNTRDVIVYDLMQFDLEDRSHLNMIRAKRRWEARIGQNLYEFEASHTKKYELAKKKSFQKKCSNS